jgi:hypothetical protein
MMKRKNFLIVFSAAFLLVLFAVSATSTNAALTNNWGVEEGTTLNYTMEETYGDHKVTYGVEISIVTVADLDNPADDIADLFYTLEVKSEDGEVLEAYSDKIKDTGFSGFYLLYPLSFDITVVPVDADGGAGLNWAAAKTNIEGMGYTVTESGNMFEIEGETTSVDTTWGNVTETLEIDWDQSEGVLKYYLEKSEYTDADITEKIELTEGELSEGFLEGNAPIIAVAALGLAFLAFLMVLVKK